MNPGALFVPWLFVLTANIGLNFESWEGKDHIPIVTRLHGA